ncbi:hypothetical protein MGYG_08884 [Nannizzia gypsea CBS 118893]|uniref:Uncharacterized protein n=1 Tax=Arthroderma gypseum (strain ATCC MYA-4604 / CBS 118893) TaxID=535722 RepID=E5R3Q1_ARTGP|nr:hypothetical protein MGYG_08884 [Nannizzia gypsea CBS 118893]EFQ97175.1 hypothetical protein MGYG_08884 [Nannizzia gypsea CBS 118893]
MAKYGYGYGYGDGDEYTEYLIGDGSGSRMEKIRQALPCPWMFRDHGDRGKHHRLPRQALAAFVFSCLIITLRITTNSHARSFTFPSNREPACWSD